jgi:hypothetical protein
MTDRDALLRKIHQTQMQAQSDAMLDQIHKAIRQACAEVTYLARWMEFRRANRSKQ